MSGPESKQPDDTALEEFLAGRSEVSQAYQAVANEVPPAELDTAVVDFARREAARAPAPGRFRRAAIWERMRWPVTAAAMMVLSVNVLLAIRNDREARQATMLESSAPVAVAEAPAMAPDVVAPQDAQEVPAGVATANADRLPAAVVPPPPPPAPTASSRADRLQKATPRQPAPAGLGREADAAAAAAPPQAPAPAAEPFPAAPPARPAIPEQGRRKRLADQAEVQQRDDEAERRAGMEAEARRQSVDSMAKQERPALGAESAGAVAGPGDAIQSFLQRPAVQRLPAGGVALEQAQRLLRQGRRRADGTCEFPAPPAVQAGAAVVELQLAVDIDTCEVLVERGTLRR